MNTFESTGTYMDNPTCAEEPQPHLRPRGIEWSPPLSGPMEAMWKVDPEVVTSQPGCALEGHGYARGAGTASVGAHLFALGLAWLVVGACGCCHTKPAECAAPPIVID